MLLFESILLGIDGNSSIEETRVTIDFDQVAYFTENNLDKNTCFVTFTHDTIILIKNSYDEVVKFLLENNDDASEIIDNET